MLLSVWIFFFFVQICRKLLNYLYIKNGKHFFYLYQCVQCMTHSIEIKSDQLAEKLLSLVTLL